MARLNALVRLDFSVEFEDDEKTPHVDQALALANKRLGKNADGEISVIHIDRLDEPE